MYNFLNDIYQTVKKPNQKSLALSMREVHAKGIFSLVIKGTEFGKLTRIFIVDKEIKPFDVQYHTHRYPIRITVLKGNITHHTAEKVKEFASQDVVSISEYEYRSVLNGGDGLKYKTEVNIKTNEYKLPIGSQINLGSEDYHTMSCSKGSIWIVEEKGYDKDFSHVLGVPFVTDDFYLKPPPMQVADKCKVVSKTIQDLLTRYESAGVVRA
jgi:hypothetical protein